ncbi:hypothetical protein [Nostoc sp.]|uniref:hypothetical protein n=1 Tax=Nostoc sp. TaxID=1180 RepID=UPI002FF92D53
MLIHILHRANGIRGYTNKVRRRGLIKNQGFEPTQVGFVFRLRSTQVCVDAISNRPDLQT